MSGDKDSPRPPRRRSGTPLVDPDPRQLLTPPGQLVAAPRQLFLLLQQSEPGCQPFLSTYDLALRCLVSCLKFPKMARPVMQISPVYRGTDVPPPLD